MESKLNNIVVLEDELARLLDWIKAAESRLSLVLTLSTAMLGALAVLAPAASKWTLPAAVVAAFAALLLGLSIMFSALAAFPRTKGPRGSVIYFNCIAGMGLPQYQDAVRELNADGYFDDLTKQCHRNAQIAERKYFWVQRSMACMFIGAVPWIVALFILYSGRSR